MLGFSWFPAVREKRYTHDCAHAKGSFRTICSDGYSTGGATSPIRALSGVLTLGLSTHKSLPGAVTAIFEVYGAISAHFPTFGFT